MERDGPTGSSGFGPRWGLPEQVVMEEARVAGAALRVEDPELGGASRRAEPVAGDGHLGPLADHIAPQPDPVTSRELQAEAGGLGDGGAQPLPAFMRLQDDEQRPGAPGEGREPSQPVADLHACDGGVTRLGQVDQQQIDGPCREQRRRRARAPPRDPWA